MNYKGEESEGFWQIFFPLGLNVEKESALPCRASSSQHATCWQTSNFSPLVLY